MNFESVFSRSLLFLMMMDPFGNLPVFLCMGDKYKKKEIKDDGSVETRKYMKYTFVSDERICDGFCYSRALKAFRHYLQQ